MDTVPLTYNMEQAAAKLGCPRTWLRDQVTAGTVPHGRWAHVKGVFFTPENLSEIIADRQRAVRAKPSAPGQVTTESAPTDPVPAPFAALRSVRRA